MKNHNVTAFQLKYVADYRVIKIVNKSTVMVASPDSKERKCNIHHIKPISPTEAFTSMFEEFTRASKQEILTCQPSLQ